MKSCQDEHNDEISTENSFENHSKDKFYVPDFSRLGSFRNRIDLQKIHFLNLLNKTNFDKFQVFLY